MEFRLTEEQVMVQDSARRMVERDIQPILDANDPDTSLPKKDLLKIYKFLAAQGLTAPRVPAEDGGGGLSMVNYGLMYEQLDPWLAISIMGQECTVSRIHAEANPEQRARWLPDLFAGKKICSTATSEPGAGSDPRGVTTRMTFDGDDIILNGRKMWISNGSVADVIAVTCLDAVDEKGRTTLKRVLVEPEEHPFEIREIDTFGLRQGHLSEAVFEDYRVPRENLLESGGDAAKMLTVTWNGNRPLIGLAACNRAQKAFDLARDYAGVREQFGKPIAGHQLIQKNLADIETAVVTSRLLCYHALETLDRGERSNGVSAMAKRYATTACENAINLAMHVHGGMGIAVESGLERLLRDCRMLPVPDATNEILTLIQGREITGIAAFR
ncbi:MAG: acyl-CoA/acyl-ACP dehydrogenase [Alphaproteobacteria bacterium]|nr:acyl-CoA/acyl-ACP dehydrogenase [Alphaproteobacteria bacterium]